MDRLAKDFMREAKAQPRHFEIQSEPWSLWFREEKLSRKFSKSPYDLVHVKEARLYWESRNIPPTTFDSVHWEAVGQALQNSPRSKRIFITKHTVGMCGVGKFMHRWKERNNPNCPRCGLFEDAPHVWVCKGEDSNAVWDSFLHSLSQWLEEAQTDPDLTSTVLDYLNSWRDGNGTSVAHSAAIQDLLDHQSKLGDHRLLEGWAVQDWAILQQEYYASIRSRKTGKRWLIALIRKFWEVAWDLWEARNCLIHTTNSALLHQQLASTNAKVQRLYHGSFNKVLRVDAQLFKQALRDILKKDVAYKKQWIVQVEAAVKAARLCRWRNCQQNTEQHLRRIHLMRQMRRLMEDWLEKKNPAKS
jgi:hypothetical protein